MGRAALVLVGALLGGGLVYAKVNSSRQGERNRADQEVTRYLNLVQGGDRRGADAMLCGEDDTAVVELDGPHRYKETIPRIVSFAIVGASDWSSLVDGHGRTYRVRLTFADSTVALSDITIEIIAGRPCTGTQIPF